jgi:hypothetical protein
MKKLNLIAAILIAASSAFAQVPSYVPTNGLVGWWPFNGNANDESGNGNNGTVNGAVLSTDRFGSLNKSFYLDGISNYIGVNLNSINNQFTSSQNISISLWIKTNDLYGGVLSFRNQNTNVIFNNNIGKLSNAISSNPGKIGFLVRDDNSGGTGLYSWGSNNVSDGSWHNIIIIRDNTGKISIYIDGVLSSVSASGQNGSLTFTTSRMAFGAELYWALGGPGCLSCNTIDDQFINGNIDDIAIWNRALSQQEITALYNAQSCTGTGSITADGPTTFCAGNYVNLTSDVLGGTYQWKKNGVNITTNGTSRTYKATATGSYTCVATCNGTALTSNAISVSAKTNAAATVTASGTISFCAGDSVTLNCTNLGSNYSVQWYRTNISMENATNYSLVVKQPGTYKVVTKNLTNGCSRISGTAITTAVNCRVAGDITSGSVIQENTNTDTRFLDNELSQGVHIFPNPNSGLFSFNFDGEETGDAVLQIINNMGQSIYQSRLTVPEGGFTQDLQLGDNITKGIYIVRLLINDSYHDSKVMVK